jgi:beta-lactamase class A
VKTPSGGRILLGLVLLFPDAARRKARRDMEQRITKRIAGFKGKVFLYAKNIDTGESYGVQPDAQVRTASTIKVPVMVEVFAQVGEGKLNWTDELAIVRRNENEDGGILFEFTPGVKIPVRDAMRLMIVLSDNIATNILLERITTDAVNARMESLGFHEIRSLRKIGGGADAKVREERQLQKFGIGIATSREMATLLEKLERGEIVSPEASKEMIAVLKRQQYHDGIGRRLKEVTVATKPGSLDHLRSDIGIVYTKAGRVVMAITCEDIPEVDYRSEAEGHLMLSDLSEMLLDGLAARQ